MKKLFVIIPVILLFFACDSASSYKITGHISSDSMNGKMVYLENHLWHMNLSSLKVLDSAIIKNNKFEFKGSTDSTYMALLNVDNNVVMMLFVESGKIQVDIPEDVNKSVATGTKQNDLLKSYKEALESSRSKLTELMQQANSPEQTEEFMRDMNKKYEEIMGEMLQTSIKFLDESPESLFSAFVLAGSLAQGIDADALQNGYDKLDDKVKNGALGNILLQTLTRMKVTEIVAGETYRDLTMNTPDDTEISLSDYVGQGKYVLVDFWASWCGPCRQENPNVVALYKEYKNKDFEIVGVSLDNNKDAWIKGIKDDGITWPQMSDLKGWDSESVMRYGIKGIPYTVLLDKEGKVIETNLRGEKLKNKLKALIR
jgi:thiol-disulfide isomerase/thioredoxin